MGQAKLRRTWVTIFWMQLAVISFAHREHKVHNIVLYPDKESWCKTTPIKQVVTWPQCSSQEIDNNVCVGACFSYMVPHSEPSAPGDLIRPYCDSCQPVDSIWHKVTLECKDKEGNPSTVQKRVQMITNCSCSSCTESSSIKPDLTSLLQSLETDPKNDSPSFLQAGTETEPADQDNPPDNTHETPDLLHEPNLNASSRPFNPDTSYLQHLLLQLGTDKLEALSKLGKLSKLEELLHQSKPEDSRAKPDEDDSSESEDLLDNGGGGAPLLEEPSQGEEQVPSLQEDQHRVAAELMHRRGPHHSLVLDANDKEKIDVESHYLQPAVPGQEISYHDNVRHEKPKDEKEF